MVPVIQPYPAGVTQIGIVQLVAFPRGFRMRISSGHFDSLGLTLFQKLQTDALTFFIIRYINPLESRNQLWSCSNQKFYINGSNDYM